MTEKAAAPDGVLGRGPIFWGFMMLIAFGVSAALSISGAIEGPAAIILMIAPAVLMVPLFTSANRRIDAGGVDCLKGEAQKRYLKRVAISTSCYLVAMGLLTYVTNVESVSDPIRVLVALLPGFAVIGVFWAIGRLIVEEQDEFIRMLVIRQSLIATGLALSVASVWGFLETADVVPHADAYWWPVMWFVGLAIGAASNRIQYGTWGAV
ncbi:MAG: hypothetical protein ABJP48_04405 [Erythrobacter sp.]